MIYSDRLILQVLLPATQWQSYNMVEAVFYVFYHSAHLTISVSQNN